MAADQIDVGKHVAHYSRVLITSESLDHSNLRLPIFGYHVQFTGGEVDSGRFGEVARAGGLRRAWDFSLPQNEDHALFNGYAQRSINGYDAEENWQGQECADLAELALEIYGFIGWPASKKKRQRKAQIEAIRQKAV